MCQEFHGVGRAAQQQATSGKTAANPSPTSFLFVCHSLCMHNILIKHTTYRSLARWARPCSSRGTTVVSRYARTGSTAVSKSAVSVWTACSMASVCNDAPSIAIPRHQLERNQLLQPSATLIHASRRTTGRPHLHSAGSESFGQICGANNGGKAWQKDITRFCEQHTTSPPI